MKNNRLAELWRKWEQLILTVVSVIVVGIGSFLFGVTKGAEIGVDPLVIDQSQCASTSLSRINCDVLGVEDGEDLAGEVSGLEVTTATCIFVGSINGTKYYPPSCKAVNRINPENLICFSSAEDAKKKGYARTKSCG